MEVTIGQAVGMGVSSTGVHPVNLAQDVTTIQNALRRAADKSLP